LLPQGQATADTEIARPSPGRRDVYDIAQERARAGDARGAVEVLMREAVQERSERARFLRRAQAASVMVDAGMEPVALPILRELLERIDAHHLEDWEAGDVIAGPLVLLYRCLATLGVTAVDPQELYVRICRLDPVQALQLGDGARSGV
jgi:type VI secretion system protein ImpA